MKMEIVGIVLNTHKSKQKNLAKLLKTVKIVLIVVSARIAMIA